MLFLDLIHCALKVEIRGVIALILCNVCRVWYGMERKFRYGMWKMPEWNGMEDFKNEMEDNLPYFHTNSILDFVHCVYRKIHTDVG